MVKLLLVSHSAALADSVVELAQQMAPDATILTAAGIDDPENPIGTDAVRIMTAIEENIDEDGIVVLMDLGSAILGTQTALDLLPEDTAARITLTAAPFVEGAIAAAITAANGGSREEVAAEARTALVAKQQALGESEPSAAPEPQTAGASGKHVTVKVANENGLHARPAAKIVTTLRPFQCDLTLESNGKRANPRKMNAVAALGVNHGDDLTLYADGDDADAALAAFKSLADSHFGDS